MTKFVPSYGLEGHHLLNVDRIDRIECDRQAGTFVAMRGDRMLGFLSAADVLDLISMKDHEASETEARTTIGKMLGRLADEVDALVNESKSVNGGEKMHRRGGARTHQVA